MDTKFKLRRLLSFRRARDGATAVEFAFVAPILVVVTLGLVEMAYILFDYHRASQAMHVAAQEFELDPAITTFSDMPTTCPGGAACDAAQFTAVFNSISGILPQLTAANFEVEYRPIETAEPGFVTPVLTVRLINLQHQFFVLNAIVPGVAESLTFPNFSTSRAIDRKVTN